MTGLIQPWRATIAQPEEKCAFCGRTLKEINYLFASKGGSTYICDSCVTDMFMRLDKMNALVMCDHKEMTGQ